MLKKVEIEVDDDLVQEVIRRYHVLDTRGAIHLALRSLVELAPPDNPEWLEREYDEFSDLNALVRRPSSDVG